MNNIMTVRKCQKGSEEEEGGPQRVSAEHEPPHLIGLNRTNKADGSMEDTGYELVFDSGDKAGPTGSARLRWRGSSGLG